MTRHAVGDAAEVLACQFLVEQGLTLRTRNFRCRCGEIDLVMRDGAEWVFVEVRFRRSEGYGGAAASVTTHKQRRIVAAAKLYLMSEGDDLPARFDVVSVGAGNRLEWIKNAFDAE